MTFMVIRPMCFFLPVQLKNLLLFRVVSGSEDCSSYAADRGSFFHGYLIVSRHAMDRISASTFGIPA